MLNEMPDKPILLFRRAVHFEREDHRQLRIDERTLTNGFRNLWKWLDRAERVSLRAQEGGCNVKQSCER